MSINPSNFFGTPQVYEHSFGVLSYISIIYKKGVFAVRKHYTEQGVFRVCQGDGKRGR